MVEGETIYPEQFIVGTASWLCPQSPLMQAIKGLHSDILHRICNYTVQCNDNICTASIMILFRCTHDLGVTSQLKVLHKGECSGNGLKYNSTVVPRKTEGMK